MTLELHGRVQRGDLELDIDLSIEPGLTTVAGGNGAGWTTGTAADIEKTQCRVQRQPSGKALCRRQAADMEFIIGRQDPGCQLAGVMSLRSKRCKDPFGKAAPAVMLLDGVG